MPVEYGPSIAIANNTKCSTPNNNMMYTRHKHTPETKYSPQTYTINSIYHKFTIKTTNTTPRTYATPAYHTRTPKQTKKANNLPQQQLHNKPRHNNTRNNKNKHCTNTCTYSSHKLHANYPTQQNKHSHTTQEDS